MKYAGKDVSIPRWCFCVELKNCEHEIILPYILRLEMNYQVEGVAGYVDFGKYLQFFCGFVFWLRCGQSWTVEMNGITKLLKTLKFFNLVT